MSSTEDVSRGSSLARKVVRVVRSAAVVVCLCVWPTAMAAAQGGDAAASRVSTAHRFFDAPD
jgi:hypothetical protein